MRGIAYLAVGGNCKKEKKIHLIDHKNGQLRKNQNV